MIEHSDHRAACPLAAVDRRLEDAHRLWHQAATAYFDPEGFRLAAQLTIQTLRTITFVLQNQKRRIPDFETWYGTPDHPGIWQERFRSNPLLRWLVETRNKIEKQGDLEARSFVRAEIIASHLDEGPRIEVPAHLFDSVKLLLRSIPKGMVGEHVMAHGTLRIQRRWVERGLPDHELLDALAIAYGHLSELVHAAHRQMGLAPPRTVNHETGEKHDIAAFGWRMPCMIAHDRPRTLLVSLADGSRLEFQNEEFKLDPTEAAAAEERYGRAGFEVFEKNYDSLEDFACGLFQLARNMFLKDGYHTPLLILLKNLKPVGFYSTPTENRTQGYLLMRHLAPEVVRRAADAAISMGEVWMAPAAALAPYQSPAEISAREEALALTLVSKTEEPIRFLAKIQRMDSAVSLDETLVIRDFSAFRFAPFYQVWGRPIPEAWLTTLEAIKPYTPISPPAPNTSVIK